MQIETRTKPHPRTIQRWRKQGRDVSDYEPKRDVKQAIDEKIRVLKDFYIVDNSNEKTIRAQMQAEITKRPDVEFDRVLDSFAKKLIDKKLG